MSRDVEERFWEKVDRSGGPGACWLWTASKDRDGYGQFRVGGRLVAAHRFAYELENGAISVGLHVDHRHTCLKNCVNQDHLRAATIKQDAENLAGARGDSGSGVRGVSWHKGSQKWQAQVRHFGEGIHVGLFTTIAEAEAAVIAKRLELFTHNDADRRLTL